MKTERPSTYVFSNDNQNPIERGNPGKRQKGGPDVRPQENQTPEPMQVDESEKPTPNPAKREPGRMALRKE